jgi:YVTN family beta-propeller protein
VRLRALPAVVLLALAATAGQAQRVEDSVDVGGAWVGSLAYNSRADVVYGGSQSDDLFFAISCSNNQLVARYYLSWPRYVTYDSADNKAYLTFQRDGADSVLVIDGTTHQRTRAIGMSSANYPVWDPVSDRLYVSCTDNNRVGVIDCRTDSVMGYIQVGIGPVRMYLNAPGRRLYVLNWDSESVSIVDLALNVVTATIPVTGAQDQGVYFASVGKFYCGGFGYVAVVSGEGDSLLQCIGLPAGTRAMSMAADESSTTLVVGGYGYPGPDTAFFVDATSDVVTARVRVVRTPSAMLWSASSGVVYCAHTYDGVILALSASRACVLESMAVAAGPFALLSVPRYGRVYVGHLGSPMVYVIRDTAAGISEETFLRQPVARSLAAHPSPFRSSVTITASCRLSEPARVFGYDGKLVRVMELSGGTVGSWFHWDGRDEQGKEVPAGVYVVDVVGARAERIKVVKLP